MSDRAARLAERLPRIGADLIVITSLTNVRYLTGYTGSNGLALIGPDTRVFVTDFRYVEQSAAEVDSAFDRRIAVQDLIDDIAGLLPAGSVRLAFEDAHMTVRGHAHCKSCLKRVELVAGGDPVESLRAVKEPGEVSGSARPPRSPTQLCDPCWSRAWPVAPSWRSRPPWSARCVTSAPSVSRLTRSSLPDPTERCRTPIRAMWRSARRAGGDRLGCGARRVLLGLHPHPGHRRAG